MRRADVLRAVAAEVCLAHDVHEDEDDVRAVNWRGRTDEGRQQERGKRDGEAGLHAREPSRE